MLARKSCRALAVAGFVLCGPVAASAQLPDGGVGRNPITRPTVSPYLNLFNRNNGVGFNYYNFVRPQQQFRQAATQMSNEISSLQTNVTNLSQATQSTPGAAPLTTGRMAPTGHAARFGSLGSYFPGATSGQGMSTGGSRFSRR